MVGAASWHADHVLSGGAAGRLCGPVDKVQGFAVSGRGPAGGDGGGRGPGTVQDLLTGR